MFRNCPPRTAAARIAPSASTTAEKRPEYRCEVAVSMLFASSASAWPDGVHLESGVYPIPSPLDWTGSWRDKPARPTPEGGGESTPASRSAALRRRTCGSSNIRGHDPWHSNWEQVTRPTAYQDRP